MNQTPEEQILTLTKFRCEEVIAWAAENSWFDTSMIENIFDKCEKGYTLTDKQVAAVKNIHERFVVDGGNK